jgi:hypothetical protein
VILTFRESVKANAVGPSFRVSVGLLAFLLLISLGAAWAVDIPPPTEFGRAAGTKESISLADVATETSVLDAFKISER